MSYIYRHEATPNKKNFLSARDAGRLSRLARDLRKQKKLSHAQYGLFDTMLWQLRRVGQRISPMSYRWMMRETGVCRATVTEALNRFEELGLLRRFKQRIKVMWQGIATSRQATSHYEFLPPATESGGQPAYKVDRDSSSYLRANAENWGSVDNLPPDPDSAFEKALAKLIATRAAAAAQGA